ncbi:hypothetical protein [Paenibacillus macerans]|uniref:hypothetical protein n=1 Tax=Paenibacillus macerans TaxID=44252 RepID=UPI003D317A66
MKRWLFVGKSDKRDLLLYLCSVLAAAGSKVLLIDGTDNGKYRYSIGGGDTRLQITEFCGFDVAGGLHAVPSLDPLSADPSDGLNMSYDYELHDLESMHALTPELFSSAEEVVWATSFDRYEVESSAQWFRSLLHMWPQLRGMTVRPVYIRTVDSYLSSEYIMGFMDGIPLEWRSGEIRIPWSELNLAVQWENDHAQRLRMGSLSRSYKRALRHLLHELAGWEPAVAKRALRQAERKQA